MVSFQNVRGTRDLLPIEANRLRRIIRKATRTAELYQYKEVITPILESYELLNAKSGEEIRSRMFVFEDLGSRKIVLRPEFTASIARVVTTSLKKPLPIRFFSVGTVYRYDEPQRGRYREFWQANYELMGSGKPEADAEIILLTNRMMKKVGLRKYEFKLGHVGILRGIMTKYEISEEIQNVVLQKMDKKEYDSAMELLPKNTSCRLMFENLRRLNDPRDPCFSDNPTTIVDRMENLLQGFEKATDAVRNLKEILKLLIESGCEINKVDPVFARGLEYYTGMIFEVYIPELDIALGGGGRYDKLIEVFGGESTPAVGVAHGLDRIMLAEKTQKSHLLRRTATVHRNRVLVLSQDRENKGRALRISERLRRAGVATEFEIMGRTFDKAYKKAKLRKIDYIVVVDPKTEQRCPESCVLLINLGKAQNDISSRKFLDVTSLVEELRPNKK
jgi:histidyl-tRNA synthetase